MSKPLKKVFSTTEKAYEDGKEIDREVELAILVPTSEVHQRARLVFAKSWREGVEAGAIMKDALDRYLRDNKLWDDLREKEFKRLRQEILDGERKIKAGGNAGLTKSAARELALKMGDLREELADLLTERNRVAANTADAIAEQSQFNYYVAACTVYNTTGKLVFSENGLTPSVGVYIDRAGEKIAHDAAAKFAEIYYGTDDEAAARLPEKEFLREYKFVDDKGRLIDKRGRLIDREGRLIDENKRFINDSGEFVDIEGNLVDEKGQYIVEFSPFLPEDEDGYVPVIVDAVKQEEDKLVETGK